MFKYYIFKLGWWIANFLPFRAAYNFAIFLSDCQFLFSPRDRKIVYQNLKYVCPDQIITWKTVREVFRNFGRYLFEFFRMADKVDASFLKKYIKVNNQHYLEEVRENGKGGVVVSAHLGNLELGSVVLRLLGYSVAVIVLPHKERPIDDLFNYQRKAHGIEVIPTNLTLRKCIETLKSNKLLAIASDRDFSQNGEILDFFNKKTMIPRGAAVFSRKLNAPLVPAFLIRNGDHTLTLHVEEPIYPDQTISEEESIMQLMKKYTAIIEKKIKAYPKQWLMFRRFWVE